MKKILCFITYLLVVQCYTQKTITTNLGDFTELKVFNGINVELIKSNEQKVVVSGVKSEKVNIATSNNILRITLNFPEITADNNVDVKLYFKNNIEIIDANGGGTITGKNIKQQSLEVRAQEKAFINLVVSVKQLKLKSTSGGIIKLTGSTENQDITLDLYGTYHGYNLKVDEKTIIKAGLGTKAEIAAGKTLEAKVSFGGSIFYTGNPEVIKDKKVIGGIIKKKDI